jgi:hypothetical protein
MVPENFDDWVICITKHCKVNLNSSFAKKRLAVYEDGNHAETKKFKAIYGQQHLENIILWYRQIV